VAKNTAQVTSSSPEQVRELPPFDQWTELQIGFAPYWEPTVGGSFVGEIIAIDARDPAFVRCQFRALTPVKCRRGPANDDLQMGPVGEDVIIDTDETFSMSVYHSLAEELQFQADYRAKTAKPVPIKVTAVRKSKTKNDRLVWNFKVTTPKAVAAELNAYRSSYKATLNAPSKAPDRSLEG
jgi:hypothetical protein